MENIQRAVGWSENGVFRFFQAKTVNAYSTIKAHHPAGKAEDLIERMKGKRKRC